MANVIVLAGGDSDEREISLLSGAAVAKALEKAGHQVTELDPSEGLEKCLDKLKAADVVFPALHGLGGEDGSLQLFLEKNGIRFVGSNSIASRNCFFKDLEHKVFVDNDILTPKTELVTYDEYLKSQLKSLSYVLKPNDGGSSIDTYIVRKAQKAPVDSIKSTFNKHGKMILQELINGTEVTVAIVGEETLPVIEIIPPLNQEFDYENKYNGKTQEICPPKNVSPKNQTAAQKIAKKAHNVSGCRHLSRTDIIITPDNKLYTLEINTIPGLTDQSLVPKAAAEIGMSMEMLTDRLVRLA